MNDKDKEEFEKAWLDTTAEDYRGIGKGKTSIASIAVTSKRKAAEMLWQAACEYKQKEIDELEKEKDYLCQKMENMRLIYKNSEKLQAENAKLRECVEFYADKNKSNSIFNPDHQNEEDCDFHEDTQFTHFGKYARQVLKELDEKL